jgi:YcxB-like protein
MPDFANISLSFHYTKSDYVRAVRAHNATRLNLPVDVFAIVVLLGVGATYWRSPNMHWYAVGGVAIAVVFALMLVAAFTIIPELAYRGESKFFGITSLVFTPEGIHIQTAQSDSRVQWSIYSRLLIAKHSYLLYAGTRRFTVIPKRVFQSIA